MLLYKKQYFPTKQETLQSYKIRQNNCELCGHNSLPSLGNRVFSFLSPTTEPCLTDLFASGVQGWVFFLRRPTRSDGGPPSIHHLICGPLGRRNQGGFVSPHEDGGGREGADDFDFRRIAGDSQWNERTNERVVVTATLLPLDSDAQLRGGLLSRRLVFTGIIRGLALR